MPTISGRVIFNRNRNRTVDTNDSGISGVSVVLQEVSTQKRITASTDLDGQYSFINVGKGAYRIVEAYGQPGGPSQRDFSGPDAVAGSIPPEADPPISLVKNPPPGANDLDSTTPNMIFVTVNDTDIPDQNFLDGPIIITPIRTLLDACATVSSKNLITAANGGTFGSEPQGSLANSGPAAEPYPGIASNFDYLPPTVPTTDGNYTILNILYPFPDYKWWILCDHSTGLEIGRFQLVNGADPGAIFFQQTVDVLENMNYLFTTWIANLVNVEGLVMPEVGVEIVSQSGGILYKATLGNQIPANTVVPEWKEIGTIFNSGNNTRLIVKFTSEGSAANGNDYAIDDVRLSPITIPEFIPVKSVQPSVTEVGKVVTYIVSLTNTCQSALTNVFFKDNLPEGVSFKAGTVTVNGQSEKSFDPEKGFNLSDIPGKETATIAFQADVTSIPTPNPTVNSAVMSYDYTPVKGGIPNHFIRQSNEVPLQINASADLSITKEVSPNPVVAGEEAVYTIIVRNAGPSVARNVSVSDQIPNTIKEPEYNLEGSATWQPWNGSINLGTLVVGQSKRIRIRGTVSADIQSSLSNTAIVRSTTADPNTDNNTSTVTTPFSRIDISKTSDVTGAVVGDTFTYTIMITNSGEVVATDINVIDPLSSSLSYAGDLRLNNKPISGNITKGVNIGSLANGDFATLTFQVTVKSVPASGYIKNTAYASYNDGKKVSSSNQVRVYRPSITVKKTSSQDAIAIGEPFDYIITVQNTGDVALRDVTVTDDLPAEFTILKVKVGGIVTTGDIRLGINIGTLSSKQSKTIEIKVVLNNEVDFSKYTNVVKASGQADIDPNRPKQTVDHTASHTITISKDKITLKKTANKQEVYLCGTITYTIQATNKESITLNHVIISDKLPDEVQFILGSVTLDKRTIESANIISGVNIGDLAPNQTKTLTFRVRVICDCGVPIRNIAFGHYRYHLLNQPIQCGVIQSNWVEVSVSSVKFKEDDC